MKRISFFILTLIYCTPMAAQELNDTIKLGTVKIEANKVTIPKSFKAISFDSTALAMNEFSTLSDLISSASPIHMKEYGAGGLSSISLRGTGAGHTQMYWNGMAINSPMLGQVDFSLFPVVFIDDLELHEGAGSILDGSGGLGGSFQVVNNADWNNRLHLMVQSQAASFDTYTQQARVKWGNTKWQFNTSAFHKYAENDFLYNDYYLDKNGLRRKNAELTQGGVMQEVYRHINSKNILSLRTWYYESDRNLPNILGSESNGESQFDASHKSMLAWENRGNRYLLEVKVAWIKDRLDYYNDSLFISSESNSTSAQLYSRYTKFINSRMKFVTQLQSAYDEAESTGYTGNKERNTVSNLSGISYSGKHHRFSVDIYSRQELINDNDIYWIPTLGLSYQIHKNSSWLVKSSASKNIKYPTLNDLYWDNLGNPDLEVEHSRTVELGLKNSSISLSRKTFLSLELTAYHSFVDNWIIWQPTGNVWRPGNLKKVESKGMEGICRIKTTVRRSAYLINLNYAYTEASNLANVGFTENTVGKQVIYVPYHKLTSSISWKRNGWNLSYIQRYTTDVYIDNQNNRYLPAFSIADIMTGKEIKLKQGILGLQLSVKNAYDKGYQVIVERPMPGRYYQASVKYMLN